MFIGFCQDTRSETVSVRLESKLRYLADLAARKQRRTLSGFIEWAIERSLALVEIGPKNETIADRAGFFWDVDSPDRFMRLGFEYEDLLNHEEQVLWKLITRNNYYFEFHQEERDTGKIHDGKTMKSLTPVTEISLQTVRWERL